MLVCMYSRLFLVYSLFLGRLIFHVLTNQLIKGCQENSLIFHVLTNQLIKGCQEKNIFILTIKCKVVGILKSEFVAKTPFLFKILNKIFHFLFRSQLIFRINIKNGIRISIKWCLILLTK